eukprot:snap_masked-scaffold_7-processed-gene-8.19-mRNA-1 protein AED:1.00 eAED:1.00 QI:0/-1/0/0/-1/1/1/0/66
MRANRNNEVVKLENVAGNKASHMTMPLDFHRLVIFVAKTFYIPPNKSSDVKSHFTSSHLQKAITII